MDFTTRYGLYEYTIMSFDLNNVPATFSRLMNSVFMEFLDKFVVVYLDEIFIYSKTEEEHSEHLIPVSMKLKRASLVCQIHQVWILATRSDLYRPCDFSKRHCYQN